LRLFEKLQRRNVFRVGVACVVSCRLLARAEASRAEDLAAHRALKAAQ